jgi:hypothetical protein
MTCEMKSNVGKEIQNTSIHISITIKMSAIQEHYYRIKDLKPSTGLLKLLLSHSPASQRPSLPPSSGNDVMVVLCVLPIYIIYAPSCMATGQWRLRICPTWDHSIRVAALGTIQSLCHLTSSFILVAILLLYWCCLSQPQSSPAASHLNVA